MAAKDKVKMVTAANIFKEGVLVIPHFYKGWTAQTKAKEEELPGIPTEIIRGVKSLLKDQSKLKALSSCISEAKNFLKRNSMPIGIEGMYWIRNTSLENIEDGLQKRKEWATEVFEEMLAALPSDMAEYEKAFPENFDRSKYPTVRQLEDRFTFYWEYRVMSPPDDQVLKAVSPELVKEEKRKWKKQVDDMKAYAVQTITQNLVERIDALRKQFAGGKINQATIRSINKELDRFDEVFNGFIAEKEVKKAIEDIKMYMEDTDAEMLRADEDFKDIVEAGMEDITSRLEKVDNVNLKRSVEL